MNTFRIYLLSLIFVALSLTANASPVSIQSISIIRAGGGQLESHLEKNTDGKIVVITKSCNFKNLSVLEQTQTEFLLSGKEAEEMLVIINNNAILATNQSITHPYIASGTWMFIEVFYQYDIFNGSVKTDKKKIERPIVLINNAPSDILGRVETQIRAVNKAVCD